MPPPPSRKFFLSLLQPTLNRIERLPDFGYFSASLADDASDQIVRHGHLVRLLAASGSVVDIRPGTVGPQLATSQRRQSLSHDYVFRQ